MKTLNLNQLSPKKFILNLSTLFIYGLLTIYVGVNIDSLVGQLLFISPYFFAIVCIATSLHSAYHRYIAKTDEWKVTQKRLEWQFDKLNSKNIIEILLYSAPIISFTAIPFIFAVGGVLSVSIPVLIAYGILSIFMIRMTATAFMLAHMFKSKKLNVNFG